MDQTPLRDHFPEHGQMSMLSLLAIAGIEWGDFTGFWYDALAREAMGCLLDGGRPLSWFWNAD